MPSLREIHANASLFRAYLVESRPASSPFQEIIVNTPANPFIPKQHSIMRQPPLGTDAISVMEDFRRYFGHTLGWANQPWPGTRSMRRWPPFCAIA